jgi:hypothetical protein
MTDRSGGPIELLVLLKDAQARLVSTEEGEVIELGYISERDEYGVHDGRELARQLIADAYRLLVPYVNACPVCADNLFLAISSQVADKLRKDGMPSIVLWDTRPGLDKPTASAAHLRAAGARTGELMVAMPKHENHSTGH